MPTEKEMIEALRMGKVSLPPLSFRLLGEGSESLENLRLDALLEVSWKKILSKFGVECKSLSTPKAFQDGLNRLKTLSLPQGYNPMLYVPFLDDRRLQELEKERVSGIDMCGNGVVFAGERFAVFRSGGKNLFTSSAPIKNIYRKNSSMVGRVFLYRSSFGTVQDVHAEINRQNLLVKEWGKKAISLSTVSKALKTLEEDLIIIRKDAIRLLQPDKLLQKLSENNVPPKIKEPVRLKAPEKFGTIRELLKKASLGLGLPFVAKGTSSVGRYAVMQRGTILSIYCPRVEELLGRMPGSQSDRFPNLELIETEDDTVYFNARYEGDFCWASPVQVYLELMAGDKRDQETAEQVKSFIMDHLEAVQQ